MPALPPARDCPRLELCRHMPALDRACPQVEPGLSTRCMVAWQPDQGQLLAAPGRTGVTLYERLSWHACGTLGEGCEIQTLCFSPDGVATAYSI